MKNMTIFILMILTLIFSNFSFAFALDSYIPEQTCVRVEDRDNAIEQIREKLQINEKARIEYDARLQMRNKEELCFFDIKNHWAISQIEYTYNWGVINGYPDDSFKPDNNITELEGVIMISNMMNQIKGEEVSNVSESAIDWETVPKWAQEKLKEKNALRIAAENQLYGSNYLNRLQFILMLINATSIQSTNVSENCLIFIDQNEISEKDLGYINTIRNMGIIIGDNGMFYPQQLVTRGEASVIIARVLNIIN